jgi:O-antigen/teichoic acid export membrane protein
MKNKNKTLKSKPVTGKAIPQNKLLKKAYLNAIASFLDFFARFLVNFVITPILITQLGSSLFGVWKIIGRLAEFTTTASGNSGQALKWVIANAQSSEDYQQKRQHVANAVAVWLCFVPILILIGTLLAWFSPMFIDIEPQYHSAVRITLALLVGNLVIMGIGKIPAAVLQGMNLGYRRMGVAAALTILSGFLMYWFLELGWGLVGLALAQVIGGFLSALLFYFVVRKNVPWFGWAKPTISGAKQFFNISIWYLAWTLVNKVILNGDLVILGIIATSADAGIFSVSSFAAQSSVNLMGLAIAAAIPGLGGLLGEKKFVQVAGLRGELMIYAWLISMVFAGIILSLNQSFVNLWVGAENYAGSLVDLLIVIGSIQLVLIRNDAFIIDLTLNIKQKVLFGIVSVSTTIGLAAYWIPLWGIAGLCLAVVIGRLILSLVYPILIGRYLQHQTIRITTTIRFFIGTALILISATLLGQELHLDNLWYCAFLTIPIGLATLILCSLSLNPGERKNLYKRINVFNL